MPPDTSLKLLEDIRAAATFILEQARGHTLRKYKSNLVFRSAIERHYIIIGEALAQLRKRDPETAGRITDCPRIVAFRNRLVHSYDETDDNLAWKIIEKELPILLDEVMAILPSNPPTFDRPMNR